MPVNNLNLLPPELSVSKNFGKLLKTVRALGVIGIAAFLIFAIGVGAFFVFATTNLNAVEANVTKLTAQVSAQQKSEQQLILVKDRLAKVAAIQKLPSSAANQTAITPYLANLSGESSIRDLTINPTAVHLSASIKNNTDLSAFLASLQSSDVFKTIDLVSFSLSPTNGYSLEISAVK